MRNQSAFTTFANCIGIIGENDRRDQARQFRNQALAESFNNTAVTSVAPQYIPRKPYVFPVVHGTFTYHTTWASRNVQQEANTIIDVLNAYRLYGNIRDILQGPRITQYVIEPQLGIPVQSFLRREREFQAALHCDVTVKFEKGYIRIDVPTGNSNVYLGDMLIDEEFQNSDDFLMAIGMGVDGKKHYIDIDKACHILISGMTGSGKSIVLHNLILSLLMKKDPSQMHIYYIDPKGNESMIYDGIDACSIVTSTLPAVELLRNLCTEMDRRYSVLAAAGCRDINVYNERFKDSPMRRDIVFIDELSDLMYTSGKTVEQYIVRLAQKARACGIHLVIATQYPVAKVVTGLIKANLPTKICLRVATTVNSMVALDMPGGEELMGHGDMLFLPNRSLKPIRLQGGLTSEIEIGNVVFDLKKNR